MAPHDSTKGYAAVRAHIVDRNMVLLARSLKRDNTWTTFGGKPENNESVEETLARELREELGIQALVYERLADRTETWDGTPSRVAVFAVTRWEGELTNRATHEHSEIRWFDSSGLESTTLTPAAMAEAVALVGRRMQIKEAERAE